MCTTDEAQAFDERARVLGNEQVGPRLYKITLDAPRMAQSVRPGQFVHMQLTGFEAHILRRPFSVYRVLPESGAVEIIYQTVGEGTNYMTGYAPGVECSIMGPLGHGWQPCDGKLLIVGGGVGAAPLFMFAEELAKSGHPFEVVLGAQTESMLVTRGDYAALLGREAACHRRRQRGPCGLLHRAGARAACYRGVCGRVLLRPRAADARRGGHCSRGGRGLLGVYGKTHGVRCGRMPFLRGRDA